MEQLFLSPLKDSRQLCQMETYKTRIFQARWNESHPVNTSTVSLSRVEPGERKWHGISWARTWKSHWVSTCRITCTFLSRSMPSMTPLVWAADIPVPGFWGTGLCLRVFKKFIKSHKFVIQQNIPLLSVYCSRQVNIRLKSRLFPLEDKCHK